MKVIKNIFKMILDSPLHKMRVTVPKIITISVHTANRFPLIKKYIYIKTTTLNLALKNVHDVHKNTELGIKKYFYYKSMIHLYTG
jgi:uncharacterized protein Usg